MKKRVVGVFECGYDQIQLVAVEGRDGSFVSCPEKGHIARIKVGMCNKGEWMHVVAVLLHEVMEFSMWRNDCRFDPNNRIRPLSHADYLFVMNHEQYNNCIVKTAEFITSALPELEKTFKLWHRIKK